MPRLSTLRQIRWSPWASQTAELNRSAWRNWWVRLARRRVLCEDLAALLLPTILFAAVCCFEPTLPQGVVTPAHDGVEPFRLNIQTAAWYEWALLDGIGESRGKKIVAFRASQGGFATVEELALIPGLPRGWLDAAREHLAVR